MKHFQRHIEDKKVGEVELSFVEYSDSKRVHLHPDIVEYPQGGMPLL
jgi:hypothetical protein